MSVTGLPLLLLLLLAHMLGDFVFQSSTWIDERYEKHLFSKRLYAHAAIHSALSLTVLWSLLMPSWQLLGFAAIIGITHFAIDLAKSYTPPGRIRLFVIDQLLHLLVIGLAGHFKPVGPVGSRSRTRTQCRNAPDSDSLLCRNLAVFDRNRAGLQNMDGRH